MTETNPLAVPDPWNAVAGGYVETLLPTFEQFASDALALVDLSPQDGVIDVAAGPGTVSLLVAPIVAKVVAVDFAAEMVTRLEGRAAETGLANIEAHVADGQSLPFEDGAFDAGFSMFGLMFFPDRSAGFRQLRRVLKPGGRAVVSSWVPAEQVPLLHTFFSALASFLPDFPVFEEEAPLSDVGAFWEEMSAAGFRDVQVHTVEHGAEIPSVHAFWEAQTRSSAPIAVLRDRLDPEAWAELGQRVVARLEDTFGTGPLDMSFQAHLGTGLR